MSSKQFILEISNKICENLCTGNYKILLREFLKRSE